MDKYYGLNIFIDFAKTDFGCPYCKKYYNDEDDKYVNRINKSKYGIIKIKCTCGKSFNMTYNYMGESVVF